MPRVARRKIWLEFTLALALAALLTVILWLALGRPAQVAWWLGCWLVSTNLLAFAYYGYDKAQAQHSGARVPELVLHGLTAVGGSVGAYLAMQLFRHKTIKGKFRILFWCIVVLQVVITVYVVTR